MQNLLLAALNALISHSAKRQRGDPHHTTPEPLTGGDARVGIGTHGEDVRHGAARVKDADRPLGAGGVRLERAAPDLPPLELTDLPPLELTVRLAGARTEKYTVCRCLANQPSCGIDCRGVCLGWSSLVLKLIAETLASQRET
ncbi:unnamed protein product [Menidia menidia]|uniref:(Atlantic silverside) hypothetical protein n=1 Tax=Menidia menidia TaxID=238744 RepID=A0A8S4B349_9TELE|nr:unnamed protein product [Menidia menidia]